MVEHQTPLKEMTDTICAISTPPGVGGIAVVRISGPQAIMIVEKLWKGKSLTEALTHTAHLGYITAPATGQTIDQTVATVYRAPGSFTGEEVVELSVHGSIYVQHKLIELLMASGCRMADPGEFTRRAFVAGHLDLAEAEAVADLIASTSAASHRLAMSQMRGELSRLLAEMRQSLIDLASLLELELDFSEEDVEFASRQSLLQKSREVLEALRRLEKTYDISQTIRRGIPIVITGAPNVGKSTLLNALLQSDRAIVSDIPGTTRDTIEEILTLNGINYRIADTAGIRNTDDTVEKLGIDRARDLAGKAAIVLRLTDSTAPQKAEVTMDPQAKVIDIITKTDHADADMAEARKVAGKQALEISAVAGDGMEKLTAAITAAGEQLLPAQTEVMLSDTRHHRSVLAAIEDMERVIEGIESELSGDFIAQDLRSVLHHLGEITGQITTPDLLATVFERFCIGK